MTLETLTESKALRLARYLRDFVGLRSTTVYDVGKYEAVQWFGDMPQGPECQSPAWSHEFEPGDAWLIVQKQQFPKPPALPDALVPWTDPEAFKRPGIEMPTLRPTRLEPDPDVVGESEEEPLLIERRIEDYPEITKAFEACRPAWEAWSREYQRRSHIQSVYAELFRLHTQVQKQGEIVELVLGLGLLTWRGDPPKSNPIHRHVVTAQVDIHFDSSTGIIQLDCPADGARLRIEDDMLDADLRPERGLYASVEDQLSAIGDDIWDLPRISTALKSWASALHPDSEWSPDLKESRASTGRPSIAFAPALILRKRTQGGMVRIYQAMIDRLSGATEEVPSGWISLVDDTDDHDIANPTAPSHAREAAYPNSGSQEIYFPLPANREQRRIVEAITHRRGVLVQGPPGTGKSHTIANLVCHLLATGKRVLITAETGRALKVLKSKLPHEIQPLCVSLLGQGGDAFAELNSSVQGITTRFAAWSPGAHDDRIAEIDRELDSARRTLAKIDTELRSLREEETYPHSLMDGRYAGTASAIARRVADERARFGWLRVPREVSDNPPVSAADLAGWLRIRRGYDEHAVAQSALRIVGTEKLFASPDFGLAVAAEQEAKEAIDRLDALRAHSAYGPILALNPDERAKLGVMLREIRDRQKRLTRLGYEWLPGAIASALGGRQARWQALLDQSQDLVRIAESLVEQAGALSVSIPEKREPKAVRADAAAAIEHLEAGGRWSSLGFFTPRAIKDKTYLREHVTVNGQPADTPDRLQLLCQSLDLSFAFGDLDVAWSEHGVLPKGAQARIRLAAIKEHIESLGSALDFARDCQRLGHDLNARSPAIPEPDWLGSQADQWLEIIDASAFEERYRVAVTRTTACLRELKAVRELHDAHPALARLIQAVEQRDITAYSQGYQEIEQIEKLRRDEQFRQGIEAALNAAVPGLVDAVAISVDDVTWDERFSDWEPAWHWAVADTWLQKRADVEYRDRLWQQRRGTDAAIGRLLEESAALRAWSHFFDRLSHAEAAALKGWREAVKSMGKATGRSARLERLRREARQYMNQCRDAIPVWIMPRYLVAEMIDPAPNRYDLVIVDEASQLGIESLFLFYIAKKIVVVGDDQQISPYGVGIADEAIASLQHHYLENIPHHNALSAQSSLYANAKIRFGQNIVLREHFRCMPEIIQFSNDLCYASNGTPLDPLRAYPANRLQPLVVRHVSDGYREGTTQHALNEPEANAILAQIVACIEDPRYAGRTMGVISLQGEAQAKLIERKLLDHLEPETIEERRLICGDAYAFQGDERHIIFLSMVAAPGETRIGALANDAARQRFNVATSRAQDQLWLFHSATLDVLSPACMRHHLLSYMLNPVRQTTQDGEQRFDSQFERDVFEQISSRGFHVRTQVCVGDPTNHRYRIDLVVEGMQGRLAVECDGDEWHGPERYEQDMARQRDLERAGWRFVRIRGGDYYRDRGRSTAPLWGELDRLGIKPGGIDEAAAEPPLPADGLTMERREVEEVVPAAPPVRIRPSPEPEADSNVQNLPQSEPAPDTKAEAAAAPPDITRTQNPMLGDYVSFRDKPGPDPRIAALPVVADKLCEIIEIEGPMLAKRAYDIYLRGCGIRRLGPELKSILNKALANAVRQGRIISENERGKSGYLFSTVRTNGSLPVKLRCRGPRTFEEIPPGELRAVSNHLLENSHIEPRTDAHLRAILECFELKRLTAQVGTRLLEILDEPGNDESALEKAVGD
jgi:very-short-patch-repair endonuclease